MKYKFALLIWVAAWLSGCSEGAADLSGADGQSGSITRFTVYNGYMYALNPNGVLTYSLADADKPELVNTLPTDYGLETIIIYDNTIYLGSRSALYILGIDNPAAPVILSQTDREAVFFGGCDPVVVKGQYAYSTVKIIQNICGRVAAQSALMVYDVSNKNAPVNIGTYFLNLPNGLGYAGNYLFVCDEGDDLLRIYDISDPANLKLLDTTVPIQDPVDLIIRGDQMIVSAKTAFQFFDLSDITNIRPLGNILK